MEANNQILKILEHHSVTFELLIQKNFTLESQFEKLKQNFDEKIKILEDGNKMLEKDNEELRREIKSIKMTEVKDFVTKDVQTEVLPENSVPPVASNTCPSGDIVAVSNEKEHVKVSQTAGGFGKSRVSRASLASFRVPAQASHAVGIYNGQVGVPVLPSTHRKTAGRGFGPNFGLNQSRNRVFEQFY